MEFRTIRKTFNKLFDWRFDKVRASKRRSLTKKWNGKRLKEELDDELLNYELDLEFDEELLNMFYPLFGQNVNEFALALYRDIESSVSLVSTGMGGVAFRDSKEDTLSLLERKGYNTEAISEHVFEYENRLINEYYENQERSTKS